MIHYVSLVLPSKSTIVTIHDIFAYCQGSWLKQKLLRFFCLVLPAWKAGYLTCISETTRQNVLKYCPWADKKIRVIYNPIDEQYVSFTREFNQSRPVILHIGTRENKNLERVIKSLEGIQCLLVIIGVLSEEQKKLLVDCHIDYINKYRLTDDEILEEYKGCDIVSFPSLKEGFGMPIIEGQAIGRPVLTSNRPPMTEVGADSVYYVNPEDVNSIKEGFQKLIANSELRTELIEKGTDNVNRFRAETIAAQYIELYKEALA